MIKVGNDNIIRIISTDGNKVENDVVKVYKGEELLFSVNNYSYQIVYSSDTSTWQFTRPEQVKAIGLYVHDNSKHNIQSVTRSSYDTNTVPTMYICYDTNSKTITNGKFVGGAANDWESMLGFSVGETKSTYKSIYNCFMIWIYDGNFILSDNRVDELIEIAKQSITFNM